MTKIPNNDKIKMLVETMIKTRYGFYVKSIVDTEISDKIFFKKAIQIRLYPIDEMVNNTNFLPMPKEGDFYFLMADLFHAHDYYAEVTKFRPDGYKRLLTYIIHLEFSDE